MKKLWEYLESSITSNSYYANKVMIFAIGSPVLLFTVVFFMLIGNWDNHLKWSKKLINKSTIVLDTNTPDVRENLKIDWHTDYYGPHSIYVRGEQLIDELFEPFDNYFDLYLADSLVAL